MSKIIFLDHDGVICLRNQWGSRKRSGDLFDNFDDKAIKTLNEILTASGADIVCSSDWRIYTDLNNMQKVYQSRGIRGNLIGYTEIFDKIPEESHLPITSLLASIRTREINAWLEKHKPEMWVAIDDLPLLVTNFVKTPYPSEGIKQCGVLEKVMGFLQ